MKIDLNDEETKAELIALFAAFQAASQTAQQAGQNTNQSISDLLQNQAQTTGSSTVESNVGDIGGDEEREEGLILSAAHIEMNKKLAYDQLLYSLNRNSDQSRVHFDQAVVDGGEHRKSIDALTVQLMQNAVKVADMVAMQAVNHNDQAFKDSIKEMVAAALADAQKSDESA